MITIKLTEQDINWLMTSRHPRNPIWRELFKKYNEVCEASGNKPLRMNCAQCYAKVMQFYKINNGPIL